MDVTRPQSLSLSSIALLALAGAPALRAQAPVPVLVAVTPPALEIGGAVDIVLEGKNLEQTSALRFDRDGFEAVPASAGGGPRWRVAVAAAVPPGLYDVRAVTPLGVSAPRLLHVAALPVSVKDPEKGEAAAIEPGVRYAGAIEEGLVDRFTLRLDRAQKVVIDCLAERIDSRADATLEVRELSSNRRVAFQRDRAGSDPVLALDAAAGVEYRIDVWDFTYRGKFPYLLAVSTLPRVLFAFPPALAPGWREPVSAFGWNLPGGKPVPGNALFLESAPVVPGATPSTGGATGSYRRTTAWIDGAVDLQPWPGAEPLTLSSATAPVSVEAEPNDQPAQSVKLAMPFDLCGRFDGPGDRDWVAFWARKGEPVEIEIRAARLGAPCDPVLLLARRAGEGEKAALRDILFLDERKSGFPGENSIERKFVAGDRDPRAVWTPPDDGEYLLQCRNRNGHGGIEAVYHLSVRPAAPGFTLVVTHSENVSGEALSVPRGAHQSCDVLLERRGGFDGVVKVEVEGLPPGLSCAPIYLAPNETLAPLAIAAARDAEDWVGDVRISGAAEWKGGVLRVPALPSVAVYGGSEMRHPLQYVHSRFTASLPVAVRGEAPFAVRIAPAEVTVHPGQKVKLTAKLERAEGFSSTVELAYQGLGERSSPDDNGKRESRQTLSGDRIEAPIELSVKNDAAFCSRTFTVYATAQADYLEKPSDPKSKRQKRRTTFASNPVLVHVVSPVRIELAAAVPPEVHRGETLRLPFRVERLAGAEGPVSVALKAPRGVKGLDARVVALGKEQASGEVSVVLGKAAPSLVEGLSLEASLEAGGKKFTAAAPVGKVEVVGLLELVSVEEARWGALRVELQRRDRRAVERDTRVRVQVGSDGGTTVSGEGVWRQGQASAAVVLDASGLGGDREGLSSLRVQATLKSQAGEITEELAFQPKGTRLQ